VIEDWLAGVYGREQGPDLIRAGRAARDWMCQPGVKDRDPDGVFLGVCLWHDRNRKAPIPLPFGQRRRLIITGWVCASASTGWRNFSNV